MKTTFFSLAITIFFFISSQFSYAQRFQDFDKIEGVQIQFRWERSNIFEAHPNAALLLRITNTTDQILEIEMDVSFYRDMQLMFQSKENIICLKPGQTRRGGPAGLRFMAEGISLDMVREEWFSWDISAFKVRVVEQCP
jgi:hypothetical protein